MLALLAKWLCSTQPPVCATALLVGEIVSLFARLQQSKREQSHAQHERERSAVLQQLYAESVFFDQDQEASVAQQNFPPPASATNPWVLWIYSRATSKVGYMSSQCVCLLHLITLMCTHADQTEEVTNAIWGLSGLYTAFHLAGAANKCIAFGPNAFFRDGWSQVTHA